MKTQKSRIILMAVAALVLMAAMAAARLFWMPAGTAGEKRITVEVVTQEARKEHVLRTDAPYLGEALREAKLAEGETGQYGMFLRVVDGRAADETRQEWWCLTKDGAEVFTGVDETPLADGDRFELTLKTGW